MSLNNLKNKLSNEKKIFSSFQIQKQSKKKKKKNKEKKKKKQHFFKLLITEFN